MRLLTATISLMIMLCSCTYSINMVHSQGSAADVIDDAATPTVTTEVDAAIPVSAV